MKRLLASVFLFAMSSAAHGVDAFELGWVNHGVAETNYKSTDHPDGIFLVETYFLGCPYCNDNAPNVNAMATEYAGEPRVQVLDVSRDCRASDYTTWISRHKPNHPVLNDCGRKLISQLNTRYYPSAYILDCQGRVVFEHVGVWNTSVKAQIRNTIDGLLAQSCSAQ